MRRSSRSNTRWYGSPGGFDTAACGSSSIEKPVPGSASHRTLLGTAFHTGKLGLPLLGEHKVLLDFLDELSLRLRIRKELHLLDEEPT
jgi:hypothetical protein